MLSQAMVQALSKFAKPVTRSLKEVPIPKAQFGAIVQKPTLVQIGEKYKPEAILPLQDRKAFDMLTKLFSQILAKFKVVDLKAFKDLKQLQTQKPVLTPPTRTRGLEGLERVLAKLNTGGVRTENVSHEVTNFNPKVSVTVNSKGTVDANQIADLTIERFRRLIRFGALREDFK